MQLERQWRHRLCLQRPLGQYFSNGDPLTARTWFYSFQRINKINDRERPLKPHCPHEDP